MKKMITLLAAVMVAGMVSAAAISWNTQNMGTMPDFTDSWKGQTVSFFLVDSEFNVGDIISGLADNGLTIAEMGAAMGALDASGNSWGSKGNNVQLEGANSSFAPDDVVYGYALFYNSDGSKVAISDVKSATVPGFGNASLGFGGASGFGIYDVVPEPTSLALLGLGVAALGLRRRFKK